VSFQVKKEMEANASLGAIFKGFGEFLKIGFFVVTTIPEFYHVTSYPEGVVFLISSYPVIISMNSSKSTVPDPSSSTSSIISSRSSLVSMGSSSFMISLSTWVVI